MAWKRAVLGVFAIVVMAAALACWPGTSSTPTRTPTGTPAPTTSPAAYSAPELKYQLIARYGEPFFCDPDYYPIGRPGQEQQNALEQFQAIRNDTPEFAAVRAHLGIPDKPDYTAEEKLSIYREHKKLGLAVELRSAGGAYGYTLRLGEGQGSRIQGTITQSGIIKETGREPSFNTCPICLTRGTQIDTPEGPVSVERLRPGMLVWTADESGGRTAAKVLATTSTPVPAQFQVLRIMLGDGRAVSASPGHPTAQGRALGEYAVGEILDGSPIAAAEQVAYDGGETFDVLPSGPTGTYWGGGILLKSTLAP